MCACAGQEYCSLGGDPFDFLDASFHRANGTRNMRPVHDMLLCSTSMVSYDALPVCGTNSHVADGNEQSKHRWTAGGARTCARMLMSTLCHNVGTVPGIDSEADDRADGHDAMSGDLAEMIVVTQT